MLLWVTTRVKFEIQFNFKRKNTPLPSTNNPFSAHNLTNKKEKCRNKTRSWSWIIIIRQYRDKQNDSRVKFRIISHIVCFSWDGGRERWGRNGVGPMSNQRREREIEDFNIKPEREESEVKGKNGKRQLAMKDYPHLPLPLHLSLSSIHT